MFSLLFAKRSFAYVLNFVSACEIEVPLFGLVLICFCLVLEKTRCKVEFQKLIFNFLIQKFLLVFKVFFFADRNVR